jgi:hypothetical protein
MKNNMIILGILLSLSSSSMFGMDRHASVMSTAIKEILDTQKKLASLEQEKIKLQKLDLLLKCASLQRANSRLAAEECDKLVDELSKHPSNGYRCALGEYTP